MIGKLKKFLRLEHREKLLVLEAWWWLALFWWAVRRRPFAFSRRLAEATAQSDVAPSRAEQVEISRIQVCVDAARSAHPVRMRCLERALTLQRLLRRYGHPALLQVGARMEGSELSAHAWVEVDGVPVGEPESIEQRFLPLIGENAFH